MPTGGTLARADNGHFCADSEHAYAPTVNTCMQAYAPNFMRRQWIRLCGNKEHSCRPTAAARVRAWRACAQRSGRTGRQMKARAGRQVHAHTGEHAARRSGSTGRQTKAHFGRQVYAHAGEHVARRSGSTGRQTKADFGRQVNAYTGEQAAAMAACGPCFFRRVRTSTVTCLGKTPHRVTNGTYLLKRTDI